MPLRQTRPWPIGTPLGKRICWLPDFRLYICQPLLVYIVSSVFGPAHFRWYSSAAPITIHNAAADTTPTPFPVFQLAK
ncbi:hypothetical protein ACU8KH_02001 [Lachancea thermotolerans]